jgi:chromosome segregation ATPase
LLVGATTGTVLGGLRDLSVAGVDADFLDEASAKLTSGKSAVVANISEEWVTPLDARMEALGGSVLRTARSDVEVEQRTRDVEALKADIARLETEMAVARGERKAKLQAKIDTQKEKLQKKREQAAQRAEQIKKEGEAKAQALEKKAAKARGDAKAAMSAQVAQIREAHQQTVTKLRNLAAERLEKRAEQLEKKAEQLKMKE